MLEVPTCVNLFPPAHPLITPPATSTESNEHTVAMSTRKVALNLGIAPAGHAVHEPKQTLEIIVSVVIFDKPRLPFTTHAEGTLSASPQVFPLMNLYSGLAPEVTYAMYWYTEPDISPLPL